MCIRDSTSSTNFTTYDVQSIDITSTSGEVCVVCRFSINTIAIGIEIEIFLNNTILFTVRFTRNLTLNIAEGCISITTIGYYDLYVYDVENDNTSSQLPAIIENQVFVDEQTTTTETTGSITTTGPMTSTVLASSSSISMTSSSSVPSSSPTPTIMPTEGMDNKQSQNTVIIYISVSVVCGGGISGVVVITSITVFVYKKRNRKDFSSNRKRLDSTESGVDIRYVPSGDTDELNSEEITTPQQNPNPIYADLAVTKRKNRPIPPAPEDNVVVYSELMGKEQADIIRQQLDQKPPPYDDVEIRSIHASVTVIPPGIHGDRDGTSFKIEGTHVSIKQIGRPQNVEETFDNQNPVSYHIPTPEDNQNDIPPPVPARVLSQHSPRRTPPIPPPTTPPFPPPYHLSSSSQVSQSGNIPDTVSYTHLTLPTKA